MDETTLFYLTFLIMAVILAGVIVPMIYFGTKAEIEYEKEKASEKFRKEFLKPRQKYE